MFGKTMKLVLTAALLFFGAWNAFSSDTPRLITFQSILTDFEGTPVTDGNYKVTFEIYDEPEGGSALWSSGLQNVEVKNGVFSYLLGSFMPLESSLFSSDTTRWLNITVGAEPEETYDIIPRIRLTTVPYAFHSHSADFAERANTGGGWRADEGWPVPGLRRVSTETNYSLVGIGTQNPDAYLHINGSSVEEVGLCRDLLRIDYKPCAYEAVSEPAMIMDESGRLGIGTDIPMAMTHIQGQDLSLPFMYLSNDLVVAEGYNPVLGFYGDPDGEIFGGISFSNVAEDLLTFTKWAIINDAPGSADSGYWNEIRFTCGSASQPWQNQTVMSLGHFNDDRGNYVIIGDPSFFDGAPKLSVVQDGADARILVCRREGQMPALTVWEDKIECPVIEIRGGSDISEPFEISGHETLTPGTVVIIDDQNPGHLKSSDTPFDTRVAGIIAGAGNVKPGLILSQDDVFAGGQNVAMSGRVYCLVDAAFGAVRPGDLLTTSPTRGHAMKASNREDTFGAIIGKALTSLDEGRGLVLVLVSLQ